MSSQDIIPSDPTEPEFLKDKVVFIGLIFFHLSFAPNLNFGRHVALSYRGKIPNQVCQAYHVSYSHAEM